MLRERVRLLNRATPGPGPVIYWMQRDQRVRDNWAFWYARDRARVRGTSLHVVFIVAPSLLGARASHYVFMLRGLMQVARFLQDLGVGFHLLQGVPGEVMPDFCRRLDAGLLVSDYSPLSDPRFWREGIARDANVAHHEVDAHNVIPPWVISAKKEYAARTIRPRIYGLLKSHRILVPEPEPMPSSLATRSERVDWEGLLSSTSAPDEVVPIATVEPGEQAAHECMESFLEEGLAGYDRLRNDPNAHGQSGLSPYLHFGQLSPGRLVEEVLLRKERGVEVDAFLEEALIHRELAENFCHYEPNYDRVAGFPEWARKTLEAHTVDERDHIYSLGQFEAARTDDPLWNASQRQLVVTGKLHGYMRMYWAKKILEWTRSPSKAIEVAITLNDRYSFDGRDPNGYAGIAWSIGGVHDRAFAERPVFGKVRFMNARGSRRKFDVDAYISAMYDLESFPFD